MSLGLTWEFSKLLVSLDTSWSQKLTKLNSPWFSQNKKKDPTVKCLGKIAKIPELKSINLFSDGDC